jgi:hypothetical protein
LSAEFLEGLRTSSSNKGKSLIDLLWERQRSYRILWANIRELKEMFLTIFLIVRSV